MQSVIEPRTLTATLVTSEAQFFSLECEWNALLAISRCPEVMLDHRWLAAWWRVYGARRTLAVEIYHHAGMIVGIAPCCIRRFDYKGIPFQRLEFLGSGENESDSVCSEYLGLIARHGYERDVANAFCEAIVANRLGRWHEAVFEMMNGVCPVTSLFQQSLYEHKLSPEVSTVNEAPYLTLPATWQDYLDSLPKKRRNNIKAALKALESAAGENGYALKSAITLAELEQGLVILERLHGARWQSEGADGAFAAPRFRRFHQEVANRLFETGQVELSWLNLRGQPIAAAYSFIANGKVYYYQSGRSPDVDKALSPGVSLLALSLQALIERGIREFDFLGGVMAYKRLFTRTSRPLLRIRIARPTVRETVRSALKSLKDRVARKGGDERQRNPAISPTASSTKGENDG